MTRLQAMIAGLAGLSGWRRWLLAGFLGAAVAVAQAPFQVWPFALLSFALLMLLLDGAGRGWKQFLTVYLFAYVYFVAGLYWIGISFFVDAERFALLLPLPVLGLPLLLALFPAGGAWLALRFAGEHRFWRMLLFAAGWTLGEWLRSFVLTGFPWNLVGYVWAGWPAAMQAAAAMGSHGLGLLTLLASAGLALAAHPAASRRARLCALLLPIGLAAVIAGGALRLQQPAEMVPDVQLRLVQPSIPQSLRWRDDQRLKNVQRHVDLSRSPSERPPTHVIWPETAIPYLLEEAEDLQEALGRIVPAGGALVAGSIRRAFNSENRVTLYNSLFALNETGQIVARYDKLHLVPFGEYLPFRQWLQPLGLDAVAVSSIDFSPGDSASALALPGLPTARVLICYEAIFPAEIATGDGMRPGLLLNVTNDSWFGQSTGPYQHFAASRMRAVEQGLPLVRAANNGISAIVDPYGRILARLDLNEVGAIDGPLPAALHETAYARWGDTPVLLFCGILLAAGIGLSRGRKRD